MLLDAENRLSEKQNADLFAIAERGLAIAEADALREPEVAGHHLLVGLHLAMGALGQSRIKSTLQGRGHRIPDACNASIRIDKTDSAAGALRLKGKFFLSAPWPIGDRVAGEKALREAIAIRSVPQAHVFLGDALWDRGDHDSAIAEWERAVHAPSAPTTHLVDPQVRELARRRIAITKR